MISFLLGVGAGMYIYKNYDVERVIQDFKPSMLKEDGMWQRMKRFEEKYRKDTPKSESS